MFVVTAIRAAHSAPEPLKVFAGSLGALTVSYSGVMDFLRLLLLVVTIAYTAVKLVNALARRDRDDHD
jgi:hypothetical protein